MGVLFIVAYAPGWAQPAMEPKGLVLLLAGALAWGWMALNGHSLPLHLPMSLALPSGVLCLSALWSVNPLLGLQKLSWLMAAVGLVGILRGGAGWPGLLDGLMTGATGHALVVVLQVIGPPLLLPEWLREVAGQGVGRGLFLNTNWASHPLLLVGTLGITRAVWAGRDVAELRMTVLVGLFWSALLLTQSRLSVACGGGLLLAWLWHRFDPREFAGWMARILVLVTLATFHPIAPWAALLVWGLLRWGRVFPEPIRKGGRHGRGNWQIAVGLSFGLLLTLGAAKGTGPISRGLEKKQVAPRSDQSWSQRRNYYLAGLTAWSEAPLQGHGLGSARNLYPVFVDKSVPPKDSAYGDFSRPNNLHSEWIEWTMEAGLLWWVALGLGLYLDRKSKAIQIEGRACLFILLLLSAFDFPLHKPVGILVLVMAMMGSAGVLSSEEAPAGPPPMTRVAWGVLGIALGVLGIANGIAAVGQPQVIQDFLNGQNPAGTAQRAERLWRLSPFDPDYLDLRTKSLVAWSASQNRDDLAAQATRLDAALRLDPHDHHLLLRRLQVAKAQGDATGFKGYVQRYSEVAPADPKRYLRLARDAAKAGNVAGARELLVQGRTMPGLSREDGEALTQFENGLK